VKRFLLLIGCLSILLSACGSNILQNQSPPPHQEAVVWPTGDYVNPFPQVEGKQTKFTLTDAQQALFDAYSKNFSFDISVFKGAAPIDVAQVFIECGIEGYWEGEYNLFYFSDKKVTKVSYKAEYDKDVATRDLRTRRDFADIMMPYLKDGEFIKEGADSGYIRFASYENTSDFTGLVTVVYRTYLKQINGIWMMDQNRLFITE